MLGKVFENLLDVNDRKSKGAFYTPREIVHYMCQESLINYLVRELNVSENAVRDFILYGDFMKGEDTVKEKRKGNGNLYISDELYLLDDSGNVVVNRLNDMDEALKNVRVADPAVGSGAFPLGMLNEIVRARQNISAYFAIKMNASQARMMYSFERSPYTLKYETIKNCIFAADIEPSAVDITQLRLWLSLVIDDEINPNADPDNPFDGHRNPIPLPNLECNILCGNSLLDDFEGIKLINNNELLGTAQIGQQVNAWESGFGSILPKLIDAQDRLFKCDDTNRKHSILAEIASLRDMIINTQLDGVASTAQIERYYESKQLASKPYILWQLDFARVFREKGGFDIVIGNPPYIDSETMMNSGLEEQRNWISKTYEYAKGNWDIYIAFFEKGLNLLSPNGWLTYITPDKWISKSFGDKLRIAKIANIKQILVAGRDVFESALVDSIITLFGQDEYDSIDVYEMTPKERNVNKLRTVNKTVLSKPFALDIVFSDSIELIEKFDSIENKVADFFSCENACATSDCYTLKEILYSIDDGRNYDEHSQYRVINTGTIAKYIDRWGLAPMKYLKDKYLYPVSNKTDFHSTFPNSYGSKAPKKKIIIKGLTLLDAAIDLTGNTIPGKSTMMIACEDIEELKILCAYINCIVPIFYIKQRYSSSSYNGGINFTKDMINNLPWVILSESDKCSILNIVDEILVRKKENLEDNCSELEEEINSIYYKNFNLTREEVSFIESKK